MKKEKGKVFNLSKEEKDRLNAIKNVSNYIIDLCRGDMDRFVKEVVKPRLSLKPEDNITIDIDKGTVTIIPAEVDPIVAEIKPATDKGPETETPVEPVPAKTEEEIKPEESKEGPVVA